MTNLKALLKYRVVRLTLVAVFVYVFVLGWRLADESIQLVLKLLLLLSTLLILGPEIKVELEKYYLAEHRSTRDKVIIILILLLIPLWIYIFSIVIGHPPYSLALLICLWLFTTFIGFGIYFLYRSIKERYFQFTFLGIILITCPILVLLLFGVNLMFW